ncbi:SDR family oxidoreductase [Marinobacter mobilis]|uniref:NADP-dependent 3-hydroxy acid dehydrogenase YdfG n=1 Tax=Marinobacter mobilis TaxID=488533 RepID=A0A1H2SEW4_9GAMM|nr:SDR family oxidoreductase [Marinobacter mobilis]SDW29674.1 NADP-dependent 3-hydroxy acid dehydrogenase YdfG [Marinobacter mobilis]
MSQNTVWITGASSGIGEALALRFARAGANVVLSARRENELQRVAERCGADDRVLVLPLDVTDWDALPAAVEAVLDRFGAIDLLVNNAGVSQRSLCKDTDMAVYRQLMEVDVMGQIALTKAVLPHMLERGSGHLAVTASVAGKVGVPLRTGYCAAKHAVMGFFDALRAEVEDQGIAVSTIVPGFIQTDVSRNALSADGSAFGKVDEDIADGMDVDECAEVIFKGLTAGKREIPVGKGKEMAALWIKRFTPELMFRIARARS